MGSVCCWRCSVPGVWPTSLSSSRRGAGSSDVAPAGCSRQPGADPARRLAPVTAGGSASAAAADWPCQRACLQPQGELSLQSRPLIYWRTLDSSLTVKHHLSGWRGKSVRAGGRAGWTGAGMTAGWQSGLICHSPSPPLKRPCPVRGRLRADRRQRKWVY